MYTVTTLSKAQSSFVAVAIALLLLFAAPGLRVHGASITVNASCSFEYALIAADLDIEVGGCVPGNGVDTITLTGDITLTASTTGLNTSVIIEGNNYTISGDDSYRIFEVTKLLNQPRPTLTIRNLTLKNGKAYEGGAIYALFSNVVIENSTFTDNRANTEGGAIAAYNAQLTVTGSSFSGNRAEDGGAIYSQNAQSMTISGSSFTNNRVSGYNQLSGFGGAINLSTGTMTISKSTFGSNRANYGGAVFGSTTATIHVHNSTFYSNTAVAQNSAPTSSGRGGALNNRGNLMTVTNSTFNGNTAKNSGDTLQSLQSWTDVELYNNIITGANGDANEHCDIDRLTQNANNFISDGTCSAALDSGDGSLNLGALTGSPAYYPLQSGSVALDAGDSTHCASDDILGTSRPQGSGCDLGAYELPVSATPTATDAMMAQAVTPTSTATPPPPPAPTNLTAEKGADGIELSWTAPAEAVDGYQILRQRPESGETAPRLVAQLPLGSATSFTDPTAADEDLYVYHVKSVRSNLYSAVSNEARLDLRPTATPTDTPTVTPTPSITPTATATSTPPPTDTATPLPCTLTEQIEAANRDRAVGTCPAGSGADTITLTKDHDLTAALPNITSEITINGNGYSLRGDNSFTILTVSSGGNLTLNRVAIMGGNGSGVGGVMNNGTLTIKNSTIVQNSGGVVGGVYNVGRLKLIHATVSGNSGGFVGGVLFSGGSNMELYNSLLAGNTNGDCFGGVNASAGNLIVSGSCGSAITDDPLLGALTGSPRHYPLQSNSPAIDAGDSSHCLSVDQLGNSRPQGARCDIGAIEVLTQPTQAPPTATATNTFTPTATNTPVPPTNTPLPTDTPVPPTNTPMPTDTPEPPTNTPMPTNTPVPPTNTPLPTNTPVPPTDTPLPTATPVPPTNTPLPTDTPVPPTNTPMPTNTPLPTDTPVPPTNTPMPTNTPVPPTSTPLPTNTPVPPTNTPIPTNTSVPANAKAVTNVQLSSSQPGELVVSWDAPSQTPRDYRINWAKVGEDFPLIRDNIGGNAFPTSPGYTISGLDEGATYKVRLRSRYSGETNGDWTDEYQAAVASS